jgi:hypothetical protein
VTVAVIVVDDSTVTFETVRPGPEIPTVVPTAVKLEPVIVSGNDVVLELVTHSICDKPVTPGADGTSTISVAALAVPANVPPVTEGVILGADMFVPSYESVTAVDEFVTLVVESGVSVVLLSARSTVSGSPFASTYEPMMMLPSASSALIATVMFEAGVPSVTDDGESPTETLDTIPPSTIGVVTVFAWPAVTGIVVVAVESALPAGDVGLVDVCCASYAVIVNTSLPPTAGAETLHVSGLPEQFGLDVVRFAAIEAGVPVYGVPLTLTSVMMTDCVALEIYFGVRV